MNLHSTDDSAASFPRIYVPLVGQYDNVGDVILRRVLLEWLTDLAELHVYVGESPVAFDSALGLGPQHVVYRRARSWLWSMIRTPSKRRPNYVFKPGEIQLTWLGLKEHLGMLPGLVAVRVRGGNVARVGVGARDFNRLPLIFFKLSVYLSTLTFWRDGVTAAKVGKGKVMPDLAFAAGRPLGEIIDGGRRGLLVVSLRGDRPYPRQEWIAGVRMAASRLGLQITVATQVERDAQRSADLALSLGAVLHPWDDDHMIQETALRALYANALLVVSDRLHVLIAALTEGVVPVAPIDAPSGKIRRHFEAAGISGVDFNTSGVDAESLADLLVASLDGRAEIFEQLEQARQHLKRVRAILAQTLGLTISPDVGTV